MLRIVSIAQYGGGRPQARLALRLLVRWACSILSVYSEQ